MPLPEHTLTVLSPTDRRVTARTIAAAQQSCGAIPWFPGGRTDPWDHVEAAMALDVAGLHAHAGLAYAWLREQQRPDGSWASTYEGAQVTDATADANFAAYVAVGTWQHHLATGDSAFLAGMWATVEAAIEFVLALQAPGGQIRWARDPAGEAAGEALLTGSSSIYLSLRCALAVAGALGHQRPDWELAVARLGHAVTCHPERFAPKDRWSMDWYYPVLGGALRGPAARARLQRRWDDFVVEGLGVRCVADRPWVTGAETCELVIALDAVGEQRVATEVFAWMQHLRDSDGSYWTGYVYTDQLRWPVERTTWTAAAVLLAADVLDGTSPTSTIFRGEDLPVGAGGQEDGRRSTRSEPVAATSSKPSRCRARR